MAVAGISTLGITFGYGVETTAGTKPATFSQLTRINNIGGLSIEPEQIDASALEDFVTRYIAGRADTGGSVPITVNATDATITEWEAVITAYEGLTGGAKMWFEVISADLTKAFFFVAQPPSTLPMPEMGQNELLTMEIPLTIEEYKGLDTKVSFS